MFVELHSSAVLVTNLLVYLQSPRYQLESSSVMLFQLVNPVLDSEVLGLLVVGDDSSLRLALQLLLQQLRVILEVGHLVLSDISQVGL